MRKKNLVMPFVVILLLGIITCDRSSPSLKELKESIIEAWNEYIKAGENFADAVDNAKDRDEKAILAALKKANQEFRSLVLKSKSIERDFEVITLDMDGTEKMKLGLEILSDMKDLEDKRDEIKVKINKAINKIQTEFKNKEEVQKALKNLKRYMNIFR